MPAWATISTCRRQLKTACRRPPNSKVRSHPNEDRVRRAGGVAAEEIRVAGVDPVALRAVPAETAEFVGLAAAVLDVEVVAFREEAVDMRQHALHVDVGVLDDQE